MSELIERRVAAEDQLKRIDIRSPSAGYVHQLAVHTIGGVISPAEPAMLIVPDNEELNLEARVMPQDIDQLAIGQHAVVRVHASNARTTPELNGTVTRISADVSSDQQTGMTYYTIRVALPREEIQRLGALQPRRRHAGRGLRADRTTARRSSTSSSRSRTSSPAPSGSASLNPCLPVKLTSRDCRRAWRGASFRTVSRVGNPDLGCFVNRYQVRETEMRIVAGIAVFASLASFSAAAADLSMGRRFDEPVMTDYRAISRGRATRVSCVSCNRLPWNRLHKVRKAHVPFGGLHPTYVSGLLWGGLTDPCAPRRFVRQTVLSRKG